MVAPYPHRYRMGREAGQISRPGSAGGFCVFATPYFRSNFDDRMPRSAYGTARL